MTGSTAIPIVAVVEDDAPLRRAIGRLLRAGGFEPLLFESAEAYIEAAPRPRCLVLDVNLSGMSGLELQKSLRASGCQTPVIVITAEHDPSIRERALQNGCIEFFLKPLDGNLLIDTIASLADRGAEMKST